MFEKLRKLFAGSVEHHLCMNSEALASWIVEVEAFDFSALDNQTESTQTDIDSENTTLSIVGMLADVPPIFEQAGLATNPHRLAKEIRSLSGKTAKLTFEVDSPGGMAKAGPIIAAAIADFEGETEAHVENALSAAYWAILPTDSVSANSEESQIGSIGAFAAITDSSEAMAKEGLKIEMLSSGPLKGAFFPGTKPTEKQLASEQAKVDKIAQNFFSAVESSRNITLDENAKEGGTFFASEALELGLIDAVGKKKEYQSEEAQNVNVNETETKEETMSVKDILANLDETAQAELAAHFAGKGDSVMAAKLAELEAQAAERESVMAKLVEQAEVARYAAEAKEIGALPNFDIEKVAKSLRDADKVSEELGASIRTQLREMKALSQATLASNGSIKRIEPTTKLDDIGQRAHKLAAEKGISYHAALAELADNGAFRN